MTRPSHHLPGRVAAPPADRHLAAALLFLALVVAAVGSLGAPLITDVAGGYHVSLAAAQWTLTITLLSGAVTTPIMGRLGSGSRRRAATIGTLAVVAAGCLCTVVPGPFALLLIGRAAQGVGLGLTALMMATARDALDPQPAARVIAMLSVASTAGVGIGYPLAGLLSDIGGVRAAYLAGLVVTAAALLVGLRMLPRSPRGEHGEPRIDWLGAALLATALAAVLTPLSDDGLWTRDAPLAGALIGAGCAVLGCWVLVERRTNAPLVDLGALRHPSVFRADAAMLVGGVGMYLLLTLATRYVQTPRGAGYGFGLDTFQAGLVLVPFSAAGFLAGRAFPRLQRRLGARRIVAVTSLLVVVGFGVFALGRAALLGPVLAVAVLGLAVGGFSAAMPAMILAVTPPRETASAMSVNQIVRSVGFCLGSALGGLILSAFTSGTAFPRESGYTAASAAGAATMTVAALLVTIGRRDRTTDR